MARYLCRLPVVIAGLLAVPARYIPPASAQPTVESTVAGERQADARNERLEEMRHLAAAVSFAETDTTRSVRHLLVEQPLLHYSDADRGIVDGTLWAYGREGRPAAILEMYCGRYIPTGSYRHAWTATSDRPLELLGAPGIKWIPQTSAVTWTPLSADLPPAREPAARLRQIKTLLKQFTSYQIFNPGKQREELRLLAQPLHRYSDPDRHIRDGALFAWALGTNPEALLFLEARDDEAGKLLWHFGVARRGSSNEIHVLFDEKEVWSVQPLPKLKPEEPYCHFLRNVNGKPIRAEP